MTTIEDNIQNSYFEWMVNLVCGHRFSKEISYRKLLTLLHDIEFRYSVPRDENRARDGVDLRYRYSCLTGCDDVSYLIDGPCSMLEMMIALAIKCEEIVDDPAYGDRTAQWFWEMVTSLGLGGMSDLNFDRHYILECVDRFLNREYSPNGKGGLFTVRNSRRDMRKLEIWYQMHQFIHDIV